VNVLVCANAEPPTAHNARRVDTLDEYAAAKTFNCVIAAVEGIATLEQCWFKVFVEVKV
jgi:hypothetical protein